MDPERYDRARPGYPAELVERLVAESPGTPRCEVLDLGCGTGIAARQFQELGCTVLGVDPDQRMAEFAAARGLPVEVSTFEDWEPHGRTFDLVVAAQSWHWVDPVAGALKAAEVLRTAGRLGVFGHVFEPPEPVAEAFATAYHRVVPDSPFNSAGRRPLELYLTGYARVADSIRETERFTEPALWRFEWRRDYRRDEWLELLPTTGGLTRLEPDQRSDILGDVGTAIDALGGRFTMTYTTLAVTAARAS